MWTTSECVDQRNVLFTQVISEGRPVTVGVSGTKIYGSLYLKYKYKKIVRIKTYGLYIVSKSYKH